MSYNFIQKDNGGKPKNYEQDIVILTRSRRNDSSSEFCRDLKGRIKGYDLDLIKDEWSMLRGSPCSGAKMSSVDCYFKSAKGVHYFIEFKNAPREALEKMDEDRIPIRISLKRKAVDSLGLVGMTILQEETGKQIQNNSVYIVVYRASAADTLAVLDINKSLTALAGGKDSMKRSYPIMWSLDTLKTVGLYSDVHTWPDTEFVSWAKDNLK